MAKAKLIELVDERKLLLKEDEVVDLEKPRYEFRECNNFEKRQNNPILQYFGYNEIKDDEKRETHKEFCRGIALRTLNNSLDDFGIINWEYDSIEKLKKGLIEKKNSLEEFKFKNYHAFWTKDYWKFENNIEKGNVGGFFDLMSVVGLVGGAILNPGCLIIPCITEGAGEISRRINIKTDKKDIGKLQKRLNTYNTLKDNIKNSKVEVVDVPEAREIIKSVSKLTDTSPYFNMNYGKINEDLREAYKKYMD